MFSIEALDVGALFQNRKLHINGSQLVAASLALPLTKICTIQITKFKLHSQHRSVPYFRSYSTWANPSMVQSILGSNGCSTLGGHTGIVMIMTPKLHFLVPVEFKLGLLQTFAGLRLQNFLFFLTKLKFIIHFPKMKKKKILKHAHFIGKKRFLNKS